MSNNQSLTAVNAEAISSTTNHSMLIAYYFTNGKWDFTGKMLTYFTDHKDIKEKIQQIILDTHGIDVPYAFIELQTVISHKDDMDTYRTLCATPMNRTCNNHVV